jgi:hypothetical protein
MRVLLLHPLFAFLVAVTYLAATVIAAETSFASCPALQTAPYATHTHHDHGHQHQHGSPTSAGECLKCCLGACLIAPCLPNPTIAASERAFDGTPVLYWAVWPAISGRAIAPDPEPPEPIA